MSVAARRTTRSTAHASDDQSDAGSIASQVADDGKVAKGKTAGNRRALTDVTNQLSGSSTASNGAVAKPQTRRGTKHHLQELVEEVIEEEEEGKVKTRAASRVAKQPSAKKTKLNNSTAVPSTTSSQSSHHNHQPATRHHQHQKAAPIQLDEEDEDEVEEMVVERKEEVIEAVHAKKHTAVIPPAAVATTHSTAIIPTSGGVSSGSASAATTAAAAVAPAVAFDEMASWQQCLNDPCQEYSDSIYQHLRATEVVNAPDPLYMDSKQGDLTHAMRSILVDWLVEVAQEYKLSAQTLFLSVSYIDRFLTHVQVDRSKLQLVGVTCMLVAAKYWEIWPPAIDEFVYISDKTYTKDEVLAMENSVLTVLKFKLTTPTSWEFSRRFCKAANADKKTEHLVDYLLELMLQESPCLNFRPSIVAASALFLSLYTLNLPPWSERLEINTGIRVEELQTCVRILHTIYVKTCCAQNSLKAVKEKYSSSTFMAVANIKPRNM